MTTRIKAVKCPHCGSEKHTQTAEKRFQCKSCGTEFFLDDDDININVKHQFDFGNASKGTETGGSLQGNIQKMVLLIVFAPLIVMSLIVGVSVFSDSHIGSSSERETVEVSDRSIWIVPMLSKGKMCIFYLVDRNYRVGYGKDKSQYTDGYYYGFRDAQTGEVLTDQMLLSEEEAENYAEYSPSRSAMRYFHQARRWYMVVPGHFIYEIDPDAHTMRDVSSSLFEKKPPMSTGLSMAKFIDRSNGEGFLVSNNMAESYYYFPATDRLYTKEAFDYACKLPPGELNGEYRDSTYYKLQCVNVNENTHAGGKLRLWKLNFKFHLGDPQNTEYFSYDMNYQWDADKRLIDAAPITDWFTGFDAQLVYGDAHYLLLAYHANVSKDAPTVLQLRNTRGTVLWVRPMDGRIEITNAAREGKKIWFKGETNKRHAANEIHCCNVDLTDGNWKRCYRIESEYEIKAQ